MVAIVRGALDRNFQPELRLEGCRLEHRTPPGEKMRAEQGCHYRATEDIIER